MESLALCIRILDRFEHTREGCCILFAHLSEKLIEAILIRRQIMEELARMIAAAIEMTIAVLVADRDAIAMTSLWVALRVRIARDGKAQSDEQRGKDIETK